MRFGQGDLYTISGELSIILWSVSDHADKVSITLWSSTVEAAAAKWVEILLFWFFFCERERVDWGQKITALSEKCWICWKLFFFSLYLSLSSFFLSFFSALSWQMQIYECFQQIHHAETSWFNKLQNNTLLPSIAFAHLLTNLTNRHCIYFLTPLENVTCSSPPVASCLRVICAEHCVPKKFGEPNQLANPKRLKTKSYWENIPQELWFWPGKTWAAMLKRNWPIFHFRFVLFLFSPLAEKRVLNVTLIAHGGCTPHLSPS